jgi:hypothetical protein
MEDHGADARHGECIQEMTCVVSDCDYDTKTKKVKAGAITESYDGSGHAMGVALMLEPYLKYQEWK